MKKDSFDSFYWICTDFKSRVFDACYTFCTTA